MASIDDFDFNGPASIVEDKYTRSVDLAAEARARVNDLHDALINGIYPAPTVNVRWDSLPAPVLPDLPDQPELPVVAFTEPDSRPTPLAESLPSVPIDDFDVEMPEMNFGTAPTLTIGQAPALPEVRDVEVPDAPDVVLPDAPQFLTLQTHSFGGVNLREEWLDKLDEIPELSIMEPTRFEYTPGARYASQLLSNLQAQLNARIQGGTGIAPAVEQQIFDRGRDRETQIALAREQEVLRGAEALGFPLPSGVLAGQLADARREYYDKVSSLSRDITIKQAELEQQNVKDAINSALQLETVLMDNVYKLEMLAFQAAKEAADNAIAAHNAALEHFKALLDGYRTYAAAYETVIKAELSKVEVFKALLQAEQTKADINRSKVESYKAEIEAAMAAVEIYKVRVSAAQTLVELERTRIQAGAEQVRAFVATVNAETAKADLYKATISAEATKAEAFGSLTRAYSAKVGAQAEQARVYIARYQAQIAAKGLEWEGWRSRLSAESSKMEAAARQSSIIMDGYRMSASAIEAKAGMFSRQWEAGIKQYEAATQITFSAAKQNADAFMHAGDARLDATKAALTTEAQQVASAWAMVSAGASISGSSSLSITQSV